MAAETILLDLDGTLWDSRPWFAVTLSKLANEKESVIEALLVEDANIVALAKQYGISKQRLVRKVYENDVPLVLYEDVPRVLKLLLDRSIKIALVTNLSRSMVIPVLEVTCLKSYFATIVTPGRDVQAKPSPSGISKALMEMGRQANISTWYVGDRLADAKAARAASVRFAWTSYGYEEEEPMGSEVVLNHFGDTLLL